MKKLLLPILFTLVSISFAQITINNSLHPADGTNRTYYAFDTSGVNLAATGSNYTWTFAGATTVDMNTYIKYSFMLPASTPYPSFDPNANKAYRKVTKNTLVNDSVYGYMISNSDSLTLTGYKEVGLYRSHLFSNPEKMITYPFTHPNTANDTYKKTINSVVNSSGSMSVVADGYGTLILGSQTYNNVLRMKITETDVRPFSGYTESYTTTRYIWCNTSFLEPLLIVEYFTLKVQSGMMVSTQTTNNAYVRSDATTSLNDISSNNFNFSVFPSPATDMITLIANNLEGTIQIINNIGVLVSVQELKPQTQLNIEQLPAGIYSIAIHTSAGRSVKKIIKTNR